MQFGVKKNLVENFWFIKFSKFFWTSGKNVVTVFKSQESRLDGRSLRRTERSRSYLLSQKKKRIVDFRFDFFRSSFFLIFNTEKKVTQV